MKYAAILIFLLFSILQPVIAQEPQIEWVRMPERTDITNRIHIFVDVSASMGPSELALAINQALHISEQPIDELNIAITVFGDSHERLQIVDEDSDIGPNWMCMPSQEHIDRIRDFLDDHSVSDAATHLVGALEAAINEDIDNISYIVISDCNIMDLHIVQEIELNGPIGFIGIGADTRGFFAEVAEEQRWWFGNYAISIPEPWK